MKKLQKILIPLDFSLRSKNAVKYAAAILEKHTPEVILVYVITPEDSRGELEIRSIFNDFEQEQLQEVPFRYSFQILHGDFYTELIYICKREEIDLLIMGISKKKSDLVRSSVIIRSLNHPVLIVPEHFENRPLKKIVFANDFKPIWESEVIKPLWEFALDFQAKVYLLHINHSRQKELVHVDQAESTLEYYLESLDHEYVYISADDMEQSIQAFIQSHEVDLLVILSREHEDRQLKSEGRLISQLTAHAEVPVLVLC